MKSMAEKLTHNPWIWRVRQSLVVAWRLRLGAGHSFACFTYCNSARDVGFLISAFLIVEPWFLTPLDGCIPIVQLSLSDIFTLKYLRIYFQPVVTCNPVNMLDSIQKHFGCSQLWPLQPEAGKVVNAEYNFPHPIWSHSSKEGLDHIN